MNSNLASLVARCHQICLPHTASARAGLSVLAALYQALLESPESKVIARVGDHDDCCIGFASGTIDLVATQQTVRRALSPYQFVILALHNLCRPKHLMAQWLWRKTVPTQNVGYILTIGVDRSTAALDNNVSGKTLLDELESDFERNGCDQVWVDTESDNERAINFYLRNGYAVVRKDYGQVLLSKPLLREG